MQSDASEADLRQAPFLEKRPCQKEEEKLDIQEKRLFLYSRSFKNSKEKLQKVGRIHNLS
jgi:hypothetical protein